MKYFLNTNTCIYFLKGQSETIQQRLYLHSPAQIAIPSIVKSELLLGAYKSRNKKKNTEIVESFLAPFSVAGFDDNESSVYAEIRSELEKKGKVIGPNDLIIASIVLSNNGVLVTNNEKEFKRIAALRVENWLKQRK